MRLTFILLSTLIFITACASQKFDHAALIAEIKNDRLKRNSFNLEEYGGYFKNTKIDGEIYRFVLNTGKAPVKYTGVMQVSGAIEKHVADICKGSKYAISTDYFYKDNLNDIYILNTSNAFTPKLSAQAEGVFACNVPKESIKEKREELKLLKAQNMTLIEDCSESHSGAKYINLGENFFKKKKYIEAKECFKKNKDNIKSSLYLGQMYEYGLGGLSKDYTKAYNFYESAKFKELLAQRAENNVLFAAEMLLGAWKSNCHKDPRPNIVSRAYKQVFYKFGKGVFFKTVRYYKDPECQIVSGSYSPDFLKGDFTVGKSNENKGYEIDLHFDYGDMGKLIEKLAFTFDDTRNLYFSLSNTENSYKRNKKIEETIIYKAISG